jgi:flagellar hook protein FlgE
MVWQVDENGEVQRDLVSALYITSPEFTYTAPAATAGVTATGNVDASDTELSSFTFNFYDSLGNNYQAIMNIQYDADTSSDTTAYYTLTGGLISQNGNPTTLEIAAQPDSFAFNAVTGASVTDLMSSITLTISGDDPSVNLSTIGSVALSGNAVANATSTTLIMDASGVTMYSDDTDVQCSRGYEVDGATTGKGKAVGVMSSVGIDSYGRIIASYTNGDKNTLGQIAVATFSNPAGLEKVGDNLYASTMNSGLFDGIGEDISSTDGSITSGYLEMSNVDLSTEFTQMITTQRGFQANSRIITVSDTLLEELINLKR